MDDQLNEYQKRSVETVLCLFEQNLRHARYWLQGGEESGILYHRQMRVSARQREMIEQRINLALALVAEIAQTFDLKSKEENMNGWLMGEMSVSWANLIDSCSTKLRRFGDVDPALSGTLDPAMSSLAQVALDIAQMIERQ